MLAIFADNNRTEPNNMKKGANDVIYHGGWQEGSVISQKLEGPIGDGVVEYPNGDRFEGSFHLSYAHIDGPAYAADGRYQFADGSIIEHAWINTSKDLECMDLIGIYPIKHSNGPDTITPFRRNKRLGLELVLAEKPYAIEWYEGERLQEFGVASYDFQQKDKDCPVLIIKLSDGTIVTQYSGKREQNKYNNWVFESSLRGSILYPDGSSLDYFGYNLKYLQPYDGWITFHNLNGKYHEEVWEKGQRVQSQEEKWDENAAKTLKLPDPFNKDWLVNARVWDGHIEYSYGTWLYDGDMVDDRPEGIGTLIGGGVDTKGRCYEGEFKDGLCHGYGVFTYPEGGIEQDGEWVEGVFQEADAPTEPVMLHVVLSGDGFDDKMVEAIVGSFPYFTGFGGLRIDRIEKQSIIFSFFEDIKQLTPGETIYFHSEIDGPEDHDGCVYTSDEYCLRITWKNK